MIDWEVSSIVDPAYDIARLFCVSELDEKNRNIFLDSYKLSGEIALCDGEIENLKRRIQLFEPINHFSIVLWAKFELQFSGGDKKKLLEKAVFIYRKKTLATLDSLNLDQCEVMNASSDKGKEIKTFSSQNLFSPTLAFKTLNAEPSLKTAFHR